MRDYVAEMNDTAMLLRKYMNQQRPQSFAAVFELFLTQAKRCDIYGIHPGNAGYKDIYDYAVAEHVERFKFTT